MDESQGSSGTSGLIDEGAAHCIKMGDITEIKSFANPPQAVKDVIVAVQYLLGKPTHIATVLDLNDKIFFKLPNKSGRGDVIVDYCWHYNVDQRVIFDIYIKMACFDMHSKIMQDWRCAKQLLAGKGKDGICQQIKDLEVQSVTVENAQRAKEILKPYNVEGIDKVSRGCGGFFRWACAVIQAVESGGGEGK